VLPLPSSATTHRPWVFFARTRFLYRHPYQFFIHIFPHVQPGCYFFGNTHFTNWKFR
jgi:hypothetical protein